MTNYPTGVQYRESLQNPQNAFKNLLLRGGTLKLDPLGMPRAISGAFASVFSVTAADGRTWAVKCFTRNVGDQGTRYRAIADALRPLAFGWKVDFQYEDDGVLVAGRWYPVLRMQWVQAQSLISFIEGNLWNPAALAQVANNFAAAVSDLRQAGLAHGDLQHGNILVAPDRSIRIIDYDGMYVPALASAGATEKGHVNYQSPLRTGPEWGPHLDRFSSWVIYASLVLLTIDPTLWPRLHQDGDEALLLRADDFAAPQQSPLLSALATTGEADLVGATSVLARVLGARNLDDIPLLDPAALPAPSHANAYSTTPTPPSAAPAGLPSWVTDAASTTAQSPPPSGSIGPSWIAQHLPPPTVQKATAPGPLRRAAAWMLLALVCLALVTPLLPALGIAALLLALLLLASLRIAYGRSTDRATRQAAHERLRVVRTEAKQVADEKKRLSKELRSREDALGKAIAAAQKQSEQAKLGEQADLLSSDQVLQRAVSDIGTRQQKALSDRGTELGNALRQVQQQHVVQYLGRFPIRSAGLPGVGPALCATLDSYGVRTAADFVSVQTGSNDTYMRLANGNSYKIPGLGVKKGYTLHQWRASVHATAVAKQPTSLPAAVEQGIRAKYESHLQSLSNEERAARSAAAMRRSEIQKKWSAAHAAAARALAEAQRVAAAERAAMTASQAQLDRRTTDVEWRRARADREYQAMSGLNFRGYVTASVKGK